MSLRLEILRALFIFVVMVAAIGLRLDLAFQSQSARAAGQETSAEVIAAQIRRQGYSCGVAEEAKRDEQASTPEQTVWILTCDNATY
ncbi:MAG: hypothetical protein ACR2PG_18960, partial [Hyphomicrobiaceae bacterium]